MLSNIPFKHLMASISLVLSNIHISDRHRCLGVHKKGPVNITQLSNYLSALITLHVKLGKSISNIK